MTPLVEQAADSATAAASSATAAETARQLLHEIQANGHFPLTTNIVKAAINDEFVEWDAPIQDGDQITLLPPFSGG